MLTQIINGHILTPQGWMKDGSVLISDGKILEVTNSDLAVIGAKVVDAKGMSIVPGFVAMNIHGGGGFDFSECTEEAFHGAVAAHQKHGATTIFPTVLAPEIGVIDKAVAVCEEMMRKKDGPILGLHIEGPYLNPKMAASLFIDKENSADPKEYKEILERTDCIKRWDSSPEIPGALEFAQYLKSRGILSAISHTEAEFDDIKTAYNAGFTHAAHFYNAMPGFHKRREYKYEGTVESVFLMDDMTVEVIADGRHLPSTILRLVYKLKGVERTCLVTDALSCAANEGKPLSDPRIIIEDGVCKLADHSSLVGSIATMDVLVRTMVQKADIPLADAVRMASETPARLMGVSDRTGTLQRGKDADIVILDRKLNVRAVWSMGNLVPETNTLVQGDVEAQARQAIGNLKNLIEASGSSMEKVVKTTVFIKDMNDFGKINDIYKEFFTSDFPARSCVEVARLPKDVLIEIEAIAVVE